MVVSFGHLARKFQCRKQKALSVSAKMTISVITVLFAHLTPTGLGTFWAEIVTNCHFLGQQEKKRKSKKFRASVTFDQKKIRFSGRRYICIVHIVPKFHEHPTKNDFVGMYQRFLA